MALIIFRAERNKSFSRNADSRNVKLINCRRGPGPERITVTLGSVSLDLRFDFKMHYPSPRRKYNDIHCTNRPFFTKLLRENLASENIEYRRKVDRFSSIFFPSNGVTSPVARRINTRLEYWITAVSMGRKNKKKKQS